MARNICHPNVQGVTIKSYVNIQGSTINGDVTSSAQYRTSPWASAIYVTRKPFFESSHMGQTIAPVCNPYYGCAMMPVSTVVRSQESLADVFGLARVPVIDGADSYTAVSDAEDLAQQNCEAAAEQFAQARGTSATQRSYTLSCVRLTSTTCSF